MSEIRAFLLPDLGEGLTESEVVTWRVAVGDTVTLNQIIAEVETAKAIVELPAPYAGTITRIYAEPGVTVNVGEPLIDFEVPDAGGNGNGNGSSNGAGDAATTPIAQAADSVTPNLVGYGAPPESGDGPARRARRRLETQAIPIVQAQNTGVVVEGGTPPIGTGPVGTGPVRTGPVGTATGGMAERARPRPSTRARRRPCANWRTISASTSNSCRAAAPGEP